MATIPTHELRLSDIPKEKFQWCVFTQFALTCDPLSEIIKESDQKDPGSIPSCTWTVVALRYYLYCWQRIGNNQDGLLQDDIDKVQQAMRILRAKV